MSLTKRICAAIVCNTVSVMACGAMGQEGWKPAAGPLMTRWAADVAPDKVWAEYPRPQMVRERWQNLNGLWDYAIAPKDAAAPQAYDGKILVPFPVESALSGVMKRVGPGNRVWYHRTFGVPAEWQGQRVLLHFGAVDWEATVTLNGKPLTTHRGGYDGFTCDITDMLAAGGALQELTVGVYDATDGAQARGKQTNNPEGIFYEPTTGIWQTVWIEPVPQASITDVKLVPDVDRSMVQVTLAGNGTSAGDEVEVIASDAGKEIGRARGAVEKTISLPIANPVLWSPENPHLYDLRVNLLHDGKVADGIGSYFAMRKIAPGADEKGVCRIQLNGKPVFIVGPLDQGYWPDGLYTAPTDAALRFDIEATKRLGFNATRKHVKVEPERWYYWCDKLGLMVIQDMPSGSEGTGATDKPVSAEAAKQHEKELQALVAGRGNHPSIIMWVVFNEGWGQYDTVRMTKWVKEMDPSRLADCASGWTDYPVGDVHDIHAYPEPRSPKLEKERAAFLGEFGGLGLRVDGHTWTKRFWGYVGMQDSAALTRRYASMLRKAWDMNDAGLCGVIYTELTDVETECNGLLTYDRAVEKADVKVIADANAGRLPRMQLVPVVATSQEKPAEWSYTFSDPGKGWFAPEFDAGKWQQGPGGFGTKMTPGSVVRTEWNSGDIWLRRSVELPAASLRNPMLVMHHDEDAEVYLNGVLASRAGGFITDYDTFDIEPAALATLKPGQNTIAVHCHQTTGGQYIDVGISEMVTMPKAALR